MTDYWLPAANEKLKAEQLEVKVEVGEMLGDSAIYYPRAISQEMLQALWLWDV